MLATLFVTLLICLKDEILRTSQNRMEERTVGKNRGKHGCFQPFG